MGKAFPEKGWRCGLCPGNRHREARRAGPGDTCANEWGGSFGLAAGGCAVASWSKGSFLPEGNARGTGSHPNPPRETLLGEESLMKESLMKEFFQRNQTMKPQNAAASSAHFPQWDAGNSPSSHSPGPACPRKLRPEATGGAGTPTDSLLACGRFPLHVFR